MSTILDCGHPPSPHSDFTTGYGVDASGRKHCYACCADNDRASMAETGRATLYLTEDTPSTAAGMIDWAQARDVHWIGGRRVTLAVTNWPGSLRLNVMRARESRNNWGARRIDVWFRCDGREWYGVNVGDNQILHCRRVKA